MAQPWEMNDRVLGEDAGGFGANDATVNPPMPPNMGPSAPAPGMFSQAINKHPGIGAGETALAFGTGTVGSALGGLGGIGGALLPGPQGQGADWAHRIQSAMQYEPRTMAGQKMTEAAGLPFEALARGGNWAGAKTSEATGSPALGAGVNAAIQAAPMLVPFGVKRAGAALNEARAGRAVEDMFNENVPAPVMQGGPGLMESGARRLMQSAIKPTAKDLRTGKAERAITTMLDEGISPTKGGLETVGRQIDALDEALTQAIKDSPAQVHAHGGPITEILSLVKDLKRQVNPNSDVRAAYKALDEFVNHPLVEQYIPIQTAQALKQGTYQALGGKSYGELKGAEIESQKALARGLKNEIAAAAPEVGPINRSLGDMMNVREVMGPRVAMEGNKNPMGLGSLSPGVLNALVWLADRSPWAKGMAARGLYNARNAPAGAVNAAQYSTLPGVAQESSEEAAKR